MKINKIIAYLVIMFIGYGLLQFIPTGGLSIPIPVPFGEVPPNYGVWWFNLPLSMFLDMVIAPPFMLIMFYFIYKAVTAQQSSENTEPSEKKRKLINNVLIWSGVLLVAGIIMHAVANRLNGILNNPVPPINPIDIAVYWFDEVLGHKLIHFGVFAFLIGCMVFQFWHRRDPKLSKVQVVGLYFWAATIGAVWCFAAAEGQTAFDVMVINIIVIPIILFCMKFRGLKLKENPLTHFVLIFMVSIIITGVTYGILSGWLPGYPFLQQPPFT